MERKQELVGKVVSSTNNKTITVLVELTTLPTNSCFLSIVSS